MFILLVFAIMAIAVSFICSVLEAALLSIIPSYVAQLEDKSPTLFKKLSHMKEHIDEPLAAILSLNTIAHTVGATGVGAQVAELYGQSYVGLASGIMTFLILTTSEILPKSIGAKYWKSLVPIMVPSLNVMIWIMKPFIWLSALITRWFTTDCDYSNIKEEISTPTMCLFFNPFGATSESKKQTSPSIRAVFPIPTDPTINGLFLYFLDKICVNLFSSSFRPTK